GASLWYLSPAVPVSPRPLRRRPPTSSQPYSSTPGSSSCEPKCSTSTHRRRASSHTRHPPRMPNSPPVQHRGPDARAGRRPAHRSSYRTPGPSRQARILTRSRGDTKGMSASALCRRACVVVAESWMASCPYVYAVDRILHRSDRQHPSDVLPRSGADCRLSVERVGHRLAVVLCALQFGLDHGAGRDAMSSMISSAVSAGIRPAVITVWVARRRFAGCDPLGATGSILLRGS